MSRVDIRKDFKVTEIAFTDDEIVEVDYDNSQVSIECCDNFANININVINIPNLIKALELASKLIVGNNNGNT